MERCRLTFRVWHLYLLCVVLFVVIEILNSQTFSRASNAVIYHGKGKCEPFPEEDVCRTPCQLAWSKGYPCEDHTVQTEDGFLLGVQHIYHGRNDYRLTGSLLKRPVVFLQHGLLSSSFDWVSNMHNESLAFLLADRGFDVWLGNVRGNTYSKKHIHYTPDDDEFWAWSWDEMAHYDLPAMIHYVLNETGQDRMFYIGHSQGSMIAFAAFSKYPELAKKINLFFALGPVSTVGYMESPVRLLAYITPEIHDLFLLLGVHDFLPNDELIRFLGSTLCETFTKFICADVIFVIAGYDPKQLNQTRLPVYIAHAPAGTSVRNMVHFAQMVRSGKFQSYDYGSAVLNLEHYGQLTAPLYNVSDMTVPTYLYFSSNDWLADPKDVRLLIPKLPNLKGSYEIPEWDHLDFIWGLNAAPQVYEPIIGVMKQHSTAARYNIGSQFDVL